MTGMFDMHNFGDLMFPLIAHARLGQFGFRVEPVSATGQRPDLADVMPSRSLTEVLAAPEGACGVLIGGGYILHGHRMDLLREYRLGGVGAWAGAASWLGATLLAAMADVPLAWNAPGAPHPMRPMLRPLAARAMAAADYLSVRDKGSKTLLGDAPERMEIVPDTVLDLPRLWPAASLKADFQALIARLGLQHPDRILAVHVRRRSLGDTPVEVFARDLSQVCSAAGLSPVFIGLGSAHSDDKIARALSDAVTVPSAALDRPAALRDIAALLAHAQAYVGSSLHGYVAAFAYGRPAQLVARPSYRKFRGFIEHVERDQDLAPHWDEALNRLAGGLTPGTLPARVPEALDRHWDRIAETFRQGAVPGRAARMGFLRAWLASGLAQAGLDWPFQPFVSAQDLAAAQCGDDVRDLEPI